MFTGPATVALCLVLTGCGLVPDVSFEDDSPWWNSDFSHRLRIDINTPDGVQPLSDAPVMVKLDPERFAYEDAAADGADLRFVASDQTTVLAHEFETWRRPPDAASVIWVRLPLMSHDSDEHFYPYYGNERAESGPNPADVWSDNFVGVYHLSDPIPSPSEGEQDIIADSTGNSHNGRDDGSLGAEQATIGPLGGALSFGPGTDDRVVIDDQQAFAPRARTILTIEAWFRADQRNVDRFIFWREASCRGFRFFIGDNGLLFGLLATTDNDNCTDAYTPGYAAQPGGARFDDGQWHYVVVVVNRSAGTMTGYGDGAELFSVRIDTERMAADGQVRLGNDIYNIASQPMALDEVRISHQARDEQWVAAQYRSMTDDLLQFGAIEDVPSDP
ncbi:MAG: DUF2341 domain-containing protein [Myxococcota bacterium]